MGLASQPNTLLTLFLTKNTKTLKKLIWNKEKKLQNFVKFFSRNFWNKIKHDRINLKWRKKIKWILIWNKGKNKKSFSFLTLASQPNTISIYVVLKKIFKNNTKTWRKYYFEVKKKIKKFFGLASQSDTISTYFFKK